MKAILFDMYGVVIRQTGDDFAPYVQRTFPQLSTDEIHGVWLRADKGELPSLEVWRQLGFIGDLERIGREYLDTLELMDGAADFLDAVRAKGLRTALVSNDSSEWSRYLRGKFDLNRRFDAVSVSGDLGFSKPDRRIFDRTLLLLGLSPADCLYLDDRAHNVAAAAALGMRVVRFDPDGLSGDPEAVSGFPALAARLFPSG